MPTHGSFELDEDAEKLLAMGADPGPAFLTVDDLCSPSYRAQLNQMFARGAWSGGGELYLDEIVRLCTKVSATSVLDYGCGNVDLAALLKQSGRLTKIEVQSYDPGVPSCTALPRPADVVVCVDVLEHVEPDKVPSVIEHLHSLTLRIALIAIATRPADKRLPDGRNAHLTIDNASWWYGQLRRVGGWKGTVLENDQMGVHMWWRRTGLPRL